MIIRNKIGYLARYRCIEYKLRQIIFEPLCSDFGTCVTEHIFVETEITTYSSEERNDIILLLVLSTHCKLITNPKTSCILK